MFAKQLQCYYAFDSAFLQMTNMLEGFGKYVDRVYQKEIQKQKESATLSYNGDDNYCDFSEHIKEVENRFEERRQEMGLFFVNFFELLKLNHTIFITDKEYDRLIDYLELCLEYRGKLNLEFDDLLDKLEVQYDGLGLLHHFTEVNFYERIEPDDLRSDLDGKF